MISWISKGPIQLARATEDWLYRNTVSSSLQPFEEAKVRLNLRLTWIFLVTGMAYSASFIPVGHYFLVAFGACISISLLLIPITLRFRVERLRQLIYFIVVMVFIMVNLWGAGNTTNVPVVLWMVLAVQLTNAILTPVLSFVVAACVISVYFFKWISIRNGMIFPNWIPSDIIEDPRLIDYATPMFFNLCLSFNSYKFNNWARMQLVVSQEKMKKLNRVIADVEWRNNLIVEKSLGFISIHDETGKIIFINNATSQALGFHSAELIGASISRILHPDVRAEFPRYLNEVCTKGSAEGIMRTVTVDKRTLFWYYRNMGIRDEFGRLNVLCFANDVTELEKTRQQLQKARANAEESDRLKSLFLANISHEFRTPMNAIIGFSELLQNPGLSPSRRTLFSRHIRERSLSLLGMLNNLIDFSRLEAGHVVLHPIDGNIDELMDKVVLAIEAEAIYINQKDVEIRKFNHLAPEMNRARLDYFKLSQVLGNLVSNAVKFTAHGYVLLECEERDPGVLLFSVSDTGEGIPPEKLETIFKPFRQANDTIQKRYGGSGLGLAICKGLVDSWNGRIWVESTPGKGSIFRFTVPWKPINSA